jgi:hypothetical protein
MTTSTSVALKSIITSVADDIIQSSSKQIDELTTNRRKHRHKITFMNTMMTGDGHQFIVIRCSLTANTSMTSTAVHYNMPFLGYHPSEQCIALGLSVFHFY